VSLRLGRIIRFLSPFWSNKKARIGTIIVLAFILMAVFAPVLAPYSPTDSNFAQMLTPSWQHPLGTNQLGQDVLSQFLYGSRVSLEVGFYAGTLGTLVALLIGLLAGYLGGWVDETLSYFISIFLVMPSLPLMVVLAAYSPVKGLGVIVFVIVITGWAGGARVLRSQVLTLRTREYVTGAQFAGDSTLRIVWREIMPNMLSLVVAGFLGAMVASILAQSGLDFLGFGDPNVISWGTMLYWANNSGALMQGQWAWMLCPGLAIAILGTGLVLMNFGVDQLTNPRLRKR
jgi:peptide/nickel transport system permease protein